MKEQFWNQIKIKVCDNGYLLYYEDFIGDLNDLKSVFRIKIYKSNSHKDIEEMLYDICDLLGVKNEVKIKVKKDENY